MANYAFMTGRTFPKIQNGHVFVGDNFIQKEPNTEILDGYTGLKFINCNLTNCKLPEDAIIEGSHPRQRSFCSHIHPEWNLTECVEECEHMVDVDEIYIDDILVDKVYYYEDKVVI